MVTENTFVLLFLGPDGRDYIYKINRYDAGTMGPVQKHGVSGSIAALPGMAVVSGLYRPPFASYLDKYDNNKIGGQTPESTKKFKELYEVTSAFFLSFFDTNLTLVDSANILQRRGENAKAFERLYLASPMAVTGDGVIYQIDNEQGYVIETYIPPYKKAQEIRIDNAAFKAVPKTLTMKTTNDLRSTRQSLTEAYAVFVKGDYIVTSFCYRPAGRDPLEPPYYYDIIQKDGEHWLSGKTEYPLICDDGEKIFLLVERDSWFGNKEIFLVGLTIEDFFDGQAETQKIEAAIEAYKNNATEKN